MNNQYRKVLNIALSHQSWLRGGCPKSVNAASRKRSKRKRTTAAAGTQRTSRYFAGPSHCPGNQTKPCTQWLKRMRDVSNCDKYINGGAQKSQRPGVKCYRELSSGIPCAETSRNGNVQKMHCAEREG